MYNENNSHIAINTIFLYIRKVVTLVIALYTSRLLLQRLGVTDFGVYGLVGSVLALFSALRGLFASSVQRFINVAKAKYGVVEVNTIFNVGIRIHRWIALIFFIIGEIGGMIMLHFLNIPPETFVPANIVLQFSILTAVVSILTVPYDAVIIANERFNTYALFSIIEYSLRLLAVWLLAWSPVNRLSVYAFLLFVVSIIVRMMNYIYCRNRFKDECCSRKVARKDLVRKMTGFAGWQFLGNTAFTLTQNGINFVLNLMGGVVVNAARSVAYQVLSAISTFVSDIGLSFQPQTMRLCAKGDNKGFIRLIFINTKANLSVAFLLALPIFVLSRSLVKLWLGEIPPYSVGFIKALMVYFIVRSLHSPLDLYFKSYGRLKAYQITELCIMPLSLILSWLFIFWGLPYFTSFLAMALCESIAIMAVLLVAHMQNGFCIRDYVNRVAIRALLTFIVLTAVAIGSDNLISIDKLNVFQIMLYALALAAISLIAIATILFTPNELRYALKIIKRKTKK